MRILFMIAILLVARVAVALDVCSMYQKVHDKEVMPRVRSGIPFKLLSLAADAQNSYKCVVRLEYDLWKEVVTVERLGQAPRTVSLQEAQQVICKTLSFPEAPAGHSYQYRLLLNPILGGGINNLDKEGRAGLLQVNWARLVRELQIEKVLLESDVAP